MGVETIYKMIQESIETKINTGEMLLDDIQQAADMMVTSLLNDGKVLVGGNGPSAALGQILTNNLVNRYEIERPCLPALTLGCDLTILSSIANEKSFNEALAREVKALGNPQDLLFLLTSSGNPSNLVQAIQAAHEKDIPVIVLNGRDGGNISSILDVEDKELRVPSNSRARIHETHLMIIFCLCHLIDEQLFGATRYEETSSHDDTTP